MKISMFKEKMRQVMNMAWTLVKKGAYTMSEALKIAWRNFKLKAKLTSGIVSFTYTKLDGSIRHAMGTINVTLVPPVHGVKKTDNLTQVYFDTEKNQWRSFKKFNLVSVQ